MAKRKTQVSRPQSNDEKPATLKDLLNPEIVGKLKEQAQEMKQAEEQRKEQDRCKAEEARKQEQKRLESNFEYLLNQSTQDWKNFK